MLGAGTGNLTIQVDDYRQGKTHVTYDFTIMTEAILHLVQGSYLVVEFPSDYPNIPSPICTNCEGLSFANCDSTSQPGKILVGYSQSSDLYTNTFRVCIHNVENPDYAGTMPAITVAFWDQNTNPILAYPIVSASVTILEQDSTSFHNF